LRYLEKKIGSTQNIYNELNRKKLAVDKKLEELSKKIEKKQEKFISLVADNLV